MLTKDDIDRVRELRARGYSIRRIAEETGHDPKTVRRHLGESPEPKVSQTDADAAVASRVFARFGESMSPEQVVVEETVAPGIVRDLHDQWLELRDVADESELRKEVSDLREAIELIVDGLADTLTYEVRRRWSCPECASTGGLRVPTECARCGAVSHWGWDCPGSDEGQE